MSFLRVGADEQSDGRAESAAAFAIVVGIAVALVLLLAIQDSRAAQGSAQSCGDVVVQFEPEGSGGAHAIRATNVNCEQARNVARSCVKGTVAPGWTAVTWEGRVQLTKDAKKVRYTGVGGGGCGHLPRRCKDFSYRGVGFFGLEVVGLRCGGAGSGAATAKAWYDQGGNCSFGHTCQLGDFSCKGNPATATVTCTKPNGFRARWQMGE